jgi:hypothetical protein
VRDLPHLPQCGSRRTLARFNLLYGRVGDARPSPSPRPSPQRRGRIVSRRFEKSCAGLAKCSFVNRATICGDPLSAGERAGVRGNAAPAHQTPSVEQRYHPPGGDRIF